MEEAVIATHNAKQPSPEEAAATRPAPRVSLRKAQGPLVLAIDVGSTASRARVYDATCTPVRGLRARIGHEFTTDADGTAILDADTIANECAALLDAITTAKHNLAGRIAAVAMDTLGPSLIGVDAEGNAVTPCYTYADSRPAPQVLALRREHDEDALQQRTGTRFHAGYAPPRLRWLRATHPDLFQAAHRWMSLGEYILFKLTGVHAVSFAAAAWNGLLDRHAATWDTETIALSGAHPEQFGPLHDISNPVREVEPAVSVRWPALKGALWFPSVPDGLPSSVGSGAADTETMALAAGTSGALRVLMPGVPEHLPSGLWCYRVDQQHSLLGGALNDAARIMTWLTERLQLPPLHDLSDILQQPPTDDAPMMLPFLTGERSPGWASDAHAALLDLRASTTALDLFRGAMEGLALRYRLIASQLVGVAPGVRGIIASGGMVEALPGWLQIAADTIGLPITRSAQDKSTLRGTALLALSVLDPDTPRIPPAFGEVSLPDHTRAAYYDDAAARQEVAYRLLVSGASHPVAPVP